MFHLLAFLVSGCQQFYGTTLQPKYFKIKSFNTYGFRMKEMTDLSHCADNKVIIDCSPTEAS